MFENFSEECVKNKIFCDSRGSLLPIAASELPFDMRRVFVISDVPEGSVRGQHSHFMTSQYLVCIRGQCKIILDDGLSKQEYFLDSPEIGLLQGPLVWGEMRDFSKEAVLLVIASHEYDPEDYISEYDAFLKARGL